MKHLSESPTKQIKIKKVSMDTQETFEDTVAIEAPLEIRLRTEDQFLAKPISVTMRTPREDHLLALGFLFTEGILSDNSSVVSYEITDENIIEVVLKEGTPIALDKADRNFYTTSSCGVCGKSSIDAIQVKSLYKVGNESRIVDKRVLFGLQDRIKSVQATFTKTGGIHAATLFSPEGDLIALYEDVGRHNAMDKLVGDCWQKGLLPLKNHILLLSGRASFELIQKATMAGVSIIASVGAPSSLAIELASENNHTLVGFLKSDRFNIYTGHERIE